MGPLGSQLFLPKPNLVGAYPDRWLSSPESCVRRCGAHAHASSKREAHVGGFLYIHYIKYCSTIIMLLKHY
jgi:hypothetical protein